MSRDMRTTLGLSHRPMCPRQLGLSIDFQSDKFDKEMVTECDNLKFYLDIDLFFYKNLLDGKFNWKKPSVSHQAFSRS